MPRARTICYRGIDGRRCGSTYEQHGPEPRLCPDGDGVKDTFRAHYTPTRAGQSFSGDEVSLLAELLEGVTRHRDMRQLTRSQAFASVAGKVIRMRQQLAERKQATSAAPNQQEGTTP